MKNRTIGIVILATNAYFVLGLRFIRRFLHFYQGESDIVFYFFSDTDPKNYLPIGTNIRYFHTQHTSWVDGTNSKFNNIIKLNVMPVSYLFYFDADTNIQKPFTDEWMLKGKLVGGEHYGNRSYLKDGQGFDRTKGYNSYVPLDSPHPYTYCYGAFFGGEREPLIDMMTTVRQWQDEDQKRGYEAPVNDESYINKYFHYNKPYIVPTEDFAFVVSDKGGIENTRNTNLNIQDMKKVIALNKDVLWDIQNKKITYGTN